MCVRKACSSLSHILFYLSVIPFHLPFPVFPKHLPFFYPKEPFCSFSTFFGNAISYLIKLISLWHFPWFFCLHLFSLLNFSLVQHIFIPLTCFCSSFYTFLFIFSHFLSIVFCNPFFLNVSTFLLPIYFLILRGNLSMGLILHQQKTSAVSISLFWLFRSHNTMKHLLHSSATTPQISLRKFWDLSHL